MGWFNVKHSVEYSQLYGLIWSPFLCRLTGSPFIWCALIWRAFDLYGLIWCSFITKAIFSWCSGSCLTQVAAVQILTKVYGANGIWMYWFMLVVLSSASLWTDLWFTLILYMLKAYAVGAYGVLNVNPIC